MPRKAIDYSRSCIYKISCLDAEIEDVYIGSTTNLVKRRNRHKNACNDPKSKCSQSPRVQIHTGARRLGKLGGRTDREISNVITSEDLMPKGA
jgi:hypothetical protein